MGVVYLARSPGGRTVAVKVIQPQLAGEPGFRTRFTREVSAAREVSGMFTALVVDADTDGPVPWLATAYVAGPSLAEAVDGQGPLPPASVLALAAGLAEGLQAIHAAGVVHRDLKPSNVLLAADGPRVIDFGISRAREASMLTQTGTVMGSPGYLSPEQAEGQVVGPPSDIFSLGGVLTFAATGEGPFGAGPTPALMYRVVAKEPNLSEVPDQVRPLIERCLAKDPAMRPTPEELLTELDAFGGGVGVVTPDWLPEPFTQALGRYIPTALTPATPAVAARRVDTTHIAGRTPADLTAVAPAEEEQAAGSVPLTPTGVEASSAVAEVPASPAAGQVSATDQAPATDKPAAAAAVAGVALGAAALAGVGETRIEPPHMPPAPAPELGGLATVGLSTIPPLGATPAQGAPATGAGGPGSPSSGPIAGGLIAGGLIAGGAGAGGPFTGGPAGPTPPGGGTVVPIRPPGRRRRLLIAAAAAIVVLAGAGTAFALSGGSPGKSAATGPNPSVIATTGRPSPSPSASKSPTKQPTTKAPKPKPKASPTHSPKPHPSVTPAGSGVASPTYAPTTYSPPPPAPTTYSPPPPAPTTHSPSPTPPPPTQSVGGYSGAESYGCTGPEPSTSGAAVSFTFVNNSSASISVGEYTTGGGYVGEGSVGPGGSYPVSTHVGYFWQVNNAGGSCLGEYSIFSSGSVTVVS
jgi:eukaryotic-like serine/threonine-protein kinase